MKPQPKRWSYLSLLPLPLLAGWFVSAQAPEPEAPRTPPARSAVDAAAPDEPTWSRRTSQYPAPQVDESKPPADPPPTF